MKVMRYILPYSNMIDIREEDRNYNYNHQIQEHEVKETSKSMNNGKKVMYLNIQVKVGESFGETGNG